MNVYEIQHIDRLLEHNAYAGRGIVIGTSADGKSAVAAYFIMGRSENSRNRVFVQENGLVRTEPFDAAKVRDPSLIIYNAVRPLGDDLIVTNGDQTDTIYTLMQQGQSFSQALETRQFEPDAPNLTPRISGLLHRADGRFSYELSILKNNNAILFFTEKEAALPAASACIRCGRCHKACPFDLYPMLLTEAVDRKDIESLKGLDVMQCMECGSCSYVCPAHRPLAFSHKLGKILVKEAADS